MNKNKLESRHVHSSQGELHYHLTGLDCALAEKLEAALRVQGCRAADHVRSADIFFCPPDAQVLKPVLNQAGGRPVVAVSRLPETAAWLDALEAGAADYYAPPFEARHIGWMLNRHCGRRSAAA